MEGQKAVAVWLEQLSILVNGFERRGMTTAQMPRPEKNHQEGEYLKELGSKPLRKLRKNGSGLS